VAVDSHMNNPLSLSMEDSRGEEVRPWVLGAPLETSSWQDSVNTTEGS